MDLISLPGIVEVLKSIGVAAVVLLVWYVDSRNVRKVLSAYRADVAEIKQLYTNNVELVRAHQKVEDRLDTLFAETLNVISLNTQAMTNLVASIKKNEFCPVVREGGPPA